MAALCTEQLDYLLAHFAQDSDRGVTALGVFPADCIPSLASSGASGPDKCFILNTDPRTKPGAHWLAFFYDSSTRQLAYFDSFGLPLSFHGLVAHTLPLRYRNVRIIGVNTVGMLQSPDTMVCGYYCALYLHYHTKYGTSGIAVEKLRRLGSTPLRRDKAVAARVHVLLHRERSLSLVSFSECVRTRMSQSCTCFNECTCRH